MARNIFTVEAHIVDANGTFNYLPGYPKNFDSNSYNGDVDKAKRRADGDMSEAWGAMCKVDTRQVQTVTLTDIFGNQLARKTVGGFPAPVPTPESEEPEQ